MRIRSHLLLLTTLVLLPGFFAAVVAVTQLRASEREVALRGLRETVRATALLVDGEVQRSLGALEVLANSEALKNGDLAALYKQAAASDQKPDVWTLVLDDTGQQLLNTKVIFGSALPPPSAKLRTSAVLQTKRMMVSDLFVSPVTGEMLTTMYIPAQALADGRKTVIARSFSVNHWRRIDIRAEGHENWIIAILDRNGKFIWRSHREAEFLGKQARPELVGAAAAASSGMVRHPTLEGIESYDAFTKSELTGWTIAVAAPVATIDASGTQPALWLIAGITLAFGIALAGAKFLSGMLLRAIDTASRAASALGRGERPELPHTAVLEVDALHRALGNAARILGDEQATRQAVEREREQLLENERLAREAAQQENLSKDRFLALLGHELRNPLAAIVGAGDVLSRAPQDAAIQSRFTAVIQRQSRHMARIVDDLLEVSRMLSGKIELKTQPLDLAVCVRNGVDSLRASTRGREHAWTVLTDEVWVQGDGVRLEQIINNLAVNALQFSPPGAVIDVAVFADDGDAVFEVSDAGPGIAADLLPKMFEPFVQGPPLAGRQPSGLGIGLALAKQLVELHGGTIQARPGKAGQGTTFSVRLPMIGAAVSSLAAPEAQTPSACHVLLVDDNDDARAPLSHLLRSMGYDVSEAGDGDTALKAATERLPDVVVMDLGLPEKSGYVVAAAFRALPALAQVPLIALSGYGQTIDRVAARAAGFDAHLTKPVTVETLSQAIEAQLLRRSDA